jgi:Uncharacterized protein conserved in bacteria
MIKKALYIFILFLIFNITLKAETCCKLQGGSLGEYTNEGYMVCMDETISHEKACMRTKQEIKGCTDKNAKNYDKNATTNDGTCQYIVYGCTDKNAFNYKKEADEEDGSCVPVIRGCTNNKADNYKSQANTNDKSCRYTIIIENDEQIPYKTIYEKDKNLSDSEKIVIKKGQKGLKTVKYKIVIDEKGKEIERKEMETKLIMEAINKVIKQGTQNTFLNLSCFLYTTTFFIMILNLIDFKYDKSPKKLLISEVKKAKKRKYLYHFLYYILVFPVFIDFCSIIKIIIKDLI